MPLCGASSCSRFCCDEKIERRGPEGPLLILLQYYYFEDVWILFKNMIVKILYRKNEKSVL